ncbi:MAG: class I SAM-dependent methyltransferase [Lentisphaerae bacterium]|nr:class I SAM-dependent methyltransferase [Lentisphaerota bacterium]
MTRGSDGFYRCKRGPHGVGKVIDKNKWVHRSVLSSLSENEQILVSNALYILGNYPPPPDIDIIVMINRSEELVTFTHSSDWKTATEPICGDMVGIKGLYSDRPVVFRRKQKGVPTIYHHKWMFVDDDYLGFDVKEAMEWSEIWENHPIVKALLADKSEHFRLRIGRQDYWQEKVLDRIGVSPTYEELINSTYIARGRSAPKNVVPKNLPFFAKKTDKILDFGAGFHGRHTLWLRQQGFDVTAYDCGINVQPGLHDSDALNRQYDIVFASNVLNVQPTVPHLIRVLDQTFGLIKSGGIFFCNFPSTPRKCNAIITEEDLTDLLNERYVEVICLQGRAWMWKCIKGDQPG